MSEAAGTDDCAPAKTPHRRLADRELNRRVSVQVVHVYRQHGSWPATPMARKDDRS
jgi:hypothetical protein